MCFRSVFCSLPRGGVSLRIRNPPQPQKNRACCGLARMRPISRRPISPCSRRRIAIIRCPRSTIVCTHAVSYWTTDRRVSLVDASTKLQSTLLSLLREVASGSEFVVAGQPTGKTSSALAPPLAGEARSDEPLRGEFSLDAAVECLDDAALTWQRDKKCFACHSNYAFLETRPLVSGKTPIHDELRAKLEELAANPRQVSFRVMEGVMAACVLAQNDALTTGKLHPVTRQSLDYMWNLQRAEGGFDWEKSSQPPAEIDDHFGATMAVIGVGVAPDGYAATPTASAGLDRIRQYLMHNPPVNLHQRSMPLSGSLHVDEIMTAAEREVVVDSLFAVQKRDGGWGVVSLGNWKRHDGKDDVRNAATAMEPASPFVCCDRRACQLTIRGFKAVLPG